MDIPTIYCESFTYALQPINTVSNLAHFLASLFLFIYILKYKASHPFLYLIPISVFGIGIGSTHWHYSSSLVGDFLDSAFIGMFMLIMCIILAWNIFSSSISRLGTLASVVALAFYIERLTYLNNSLIYLYFFVLLVSALLYLSKTIFEKIQILLMTLVFFVAIFFRTIDINICTSFVHGTHFIWHILIAIVLAYLPITVLKLTKY